MTLSEIFYWLMNMSILGSLLGLIVLIIRNFSKVSREFIALLWLIPLIRFLMPFAFSSWFSILNIVKQILPIKTRVVGISESITMTQMNTANSSGALTKTNYIAPIKESSVVETYKLSWLRQVSEIFSVIWFTVAIILLLLFAFGYFSSKIKLRNATLLSNQIYTLKDVEMPIVAGVISPKIILPSQNIPYMEYVIMHEKAHIKRKDNFIRILSILIAILHWYNPLIWYYTKCINEDLELACDSQVLKKLSKPEQKNYAKAILSYSGKNNLFVSAFNGSLTHKRISQILSHRKTTKISSFLLTLFFIVLVAVTLTNALI